MNELFQFVPPEPAALNARSKLRQAVFDGRASRHADFFQFFGKLQLRKRQHEGTKDTKTHLEGF